MMWIPTTGDGIIKIEMHFLPDVYVPCEVCGGKRYNRETLDVKYKGKSIYDVLNMTVEEALKFFENVPSIYRKIETLYDVGLSYIRLGQPSTELSGGEAQRIKLATELSKRGFDIADGSHFTHDVGLGALLMRNDDRRAEQFRISVCPLGAAHVGCCDREILDVEALDVGYENAAGVEGVDRDIEKSLNLVGMQVHRHHAVDTCGHQHVGHQFGADRHAGTVFAVLARPAEVGHHGHDLVGRGAAGTFRNA